MISNDPNMAILGSLEIIVPLVSEFWTKVFFENLNFHSSKDNFQSLSHLKHEKYDFKAKTPMLKNIFK